MVSPWSDNGGSLLIRLKLLFLHGISTTCGGILMDIFAVVLITTYFSLFLWSVVMNEYLCRSSLGRSSCLRFCLGALRFDYKGNLDLLLPIKSHLKISPARCFLTAGMTLVSVIQVVKTTHRQLRSSRAWNALMNFRERWFPHHLSSVSK